MPFWSQVGDDDEHGKGTMKAVRRWARQPAHAALAHTIEEADCLKVSKADNKAKLRDHLGKLFREVPVRPAHRSYHLFRLRPIAKPR